MGKALEYYRRTEDKRGTSIALNGLTHALCNRGDYARAEPLGEESVALARQTSDQWGLANALWYMGNVTWQQGQYDCSRTFLEESIQLHRALNNESGLIYAQLNLASWIQIWVMSCVVSKHARECWKRLQPSLTEAVLPVRWSD